MRKTIGNIGVTAFLGVLALALQTTFAGQGTLESAVGTVSKVDGNTLALKTDDSSKTLSCTDTKSTLFVNSIGVPVPAWTLKSGVPVTVYYTTCGNTIVCSKIVVDCTSFPGYCKGTPVSP